MSCSPNRIRTRGLRTHFTALFTGDNGTDKPIVSNCNGRQIPGGKGSMTDAGTHVPLIANWPGTIPPGRTCHDLVDFTDFLPTLCGAAGVTIPKRMTLDGRGFWPQLKGQAGTPRPWIYCWYSRNGQPPAQEWARTQRYKLYRTGQFYDLTTDPLEQHPLPTNSLTHEARATQAMLQTALAKYEDIPRPSGVL